VTAPNDATLRAYAPAGLCMMGVEESGEDSTCGQPATHKLTGPHDYDPDHWYCEAHGREVHAGIEHNHRWRVTPLPGVAESVALATEVIALRAAVRAYADAHAASCFELGAYQGGDKSPERRTAAENASRASARAFGEMLRLAGVV
jgi:hypothetical protein